MHIIFIINFISPIRVFEFNKFYEFYKKKGDTLTVLFLSNTDKNRSWEKEKNIKFPYKILKNFALRVQGKDLFTFFINPDITKYLEIENPNIILCFGWDHYAAYAANYWARKHHKKFILSCGSTKYEKSWRRTLCYPMVKYLLKRTDKFLADSTRAKEYLVDLKVNPQKIKILFNTIDTGYFAEKNKNFSPNDKINLKNKLGIKTSKIILFNGQLIERKGIYDLLRGYNLYYQKNNDVSLLMVGVGKEKEKMVNYINKNKIANVFLTNFIQYKNLYSYYSIADLLVLPSYEEIWGLVINEALACGLPVITTNVTGASVDLIEEGKNGYIIKPNSPEDIFQAITKIYLKKLNINNNSREILKKTDIDYMLAHNDFL